MITPAEAWQTIAAHTRPLPAVQLSLQDSVRHVLVEPALADRDIPSADRSAMDGYAVRAEDIVSAPVDLAVCGEVAAGSDAAPLVDAGTCARIYTGANMPPGADAVVMVEDTETRGQEAGVRGQGSAGAEGEVVTFLKAVAKGRNIFRRGENARRGEELLPAGTRLEAAQIGVCAAIGCNQLTVHRRPTVSILATGQELLDVADDVSLHQIRDSNGPMLAAALTLDGYDIAMRESVADTSEAILAKLRAALAASDVVLVTGGVSVGRYDLVPGAVTDAGATIHFHGVGMKPGKPQLFATTPEGKCIFGLPGNPLSVMTGFREFVRPALSRLGGLPLAACRPTTRVRMGNDVPSRRGRQRYVPCRVTWEVDGPVAHTITCKGSADLVAGGKADGTIVVPPEGDGLAAGDMAEFRAWRELL